MSRIVLGVSGGIAAYKACLLLRLFTEAGHDVVVVPTRNALEFVGATTWAALSGNPVHTDVFSGAEQVPHVRLGREADLVVFMDHGKVAEMGTFNDLSQSNGRFAALLRASGILTDDDVRKSHTAA